MLLFFPTENFVRGMSARRPKVDPRETNLHFPSYLKICDRHRMIPKSMHIPDGSKDSAARTLARTSLNELSVGRLPDPPPPEVLLNSRSGPLSCHPMLSLECDTGVCTCLRRCNRGRLLSFQPFLRRSSSPPFSTASRFCTFFFWCSVVHCGLPGLLPGLAFVPFFFHSDHDRPARMNSRAFSLVWLGSNRRGEDGCQSS